MNRLRVLKQRALRAEIAVAKVNFGQGTQYCCAHGRNGWGDCSEGMSKRQAIQLAARWAMPSKAQYLTVSSIDEHGVETVVIHERLE